MISAVMLKVAVFEYLPSRIYSLLASTSIEYTLAALIPFLPYNKHFLIVTSIIF